MRIERELVGTAYRVFQVRGTSKAREEERQFDDPIAATHYWIELQRRYLEQQLAQIPPVPEAAHNEVLDLRDVDDLPEYVGEYPPIGGAIK